MKKLLAGAALVALLAGAALPVIADQIAPLSKAMIFLFVDAPAQLTPTKTDVGTISVVATPNVYASKAIGTAAADRLVVVAYATRGNFVTSADIGGISAAVHVSSNNTQNGCGLASCIVPTGTTATINIYSSGGNFSSGITVYTIYLGSVSATPTDTDAANSASASVLTMSALTVPSNGCAITSSSDAGVASQTWSGATEDTDAAFGSRHYSTASTIISGTNAISTTYSSASVVTCASAAWG